MQSYYLLLCLFSGETWGIASCSGERIIDVTIHKQENVKAISRDVQTEKLFLREEVRVNRQSKKSNKQRRILSNNTKQSTSKTEYNVNRIH